MSTAVEKPITRQCTAKSKRSQERCRRSAVPGATVCKMHGGAIPAVKAKANLRLLSLVEPAIGVLEHEMHNSDASAGERIRAAEAVLDRAGYPRRVQADTSTARDILVLRLLELQARRAAGEEEVVIDVEFTEDDGVEG